MNRISPLQLLHKTLATELNSDEISVVSGGQDTHSSDMTMRYDWTVDCDRTSGDRVRDND